MRRTVDTPKGKTGCGARLVRKRNNIIIESLFFSFRFHILSNGRRRRRCYYDYGVRRRGHNTFHARRVVFAAAPPSPIIKDGWPASHQLPSDSGRSPGHPACLSTTRLVYIVYTCPPPKGSQ